MLTTGATRLGLDVSPHSYIHSPFLRPVNQLHPTFRVCRIRVCPSLRLLYPLSDSKKPFRNRNLSPERSSQTFDRTACHVPVSILRRQSVCSQGSISALSFRRSSPFAQMRLARRSMRSRSATEILPASGPVEQMKEEPP